MCNFKSGLILKNKVVLAPDNNESHSDLLKSLGIEDTRENAVRKFIRAELTPNNDNKLEKVDTWKYKVDQDITPDWYDEDPERYENEFREVVKDYMTKYLKDKMVVGGYIWSPIKTESDKTWFLMDGFYDKSMFGRNNNYANSYVREKLINSDLANELKENFGDRLTPIATDLLSLDGLDDYGKVEGDILAIPTIDLYRECRKRISKIDKWWWLATPDSTPSGYCSDCVHYVYSYGSVGYDWYNSCGAVRPFFILRNN